MATRELQGRELILWDVVQEHLEEAGFLWSLWEKSLDAPDFTLPEVAAGEEERLLAHIDALVVGGEPVARELLLPALEDPDAELAFAAALALLCGVEQTAHACVVMDLLDVSSGQRLAALRRALQLSLPDSLAGSLVSRLDRGSPQTRAALLEVLAFRCLDPGPTLERLLEDPDPAVRKAALQAARLPSALFLQPLLARALTDPDPTARDAALETGLLLRIPGAWERCKAVVSDQEPRPRRAMTLLALKGRHGETNPLVAALRDEAAGLDALWALGFCGSLAAADACIDYLEDPTRARLAGEAFCAIVGLDLHATQMAIKPASDDDEQEDLDLDADLVPSPEQALPLPDAPAIRRWWHLHRGGFHPEARYLKGAPSDNNALLRELCLGPMRRRHLLAMELALRGREHAPMQTRCWCREQLWRLKQIGAD